MHAMIAMQESKSLGYPSNHTEFSCLLQLKDYAYENRGQFAIGGYSLPWDKANENQVRSNTKESEHLIPAILFPVALLVGFSRGYEVVKIAAEKFNKRDSHYYRLFRSFQFLAVLNNAVHIWCMDDGQW